jgi:putative ABC transport system ATP-binding protein
MAHQPLLQLDSLTKSYREGDSLRTVFSDLSASFHPGECVALLGRSGSGKSTLLNLISGIDRPDAGDIIFDNVQLNRLSEHERTLFRRHHIGFVFQFFNLIGTLTVRENLQLPLELTGKLTADRKNRVGHMLAEVGLADRGESFPDRLSGGEQQRVAIARALIHEPRLVLADEPTGNLDAETGNQVLELLQHTTRKAGHAMILVTHSAEIAARADRILTLRNGTLEEKMREPSP